MMTKNKTTIHLSFDEFHLASPQVWGNVRIVPILNDNPCEDLRLFKEENESNSVRSGSSIYSSYIPHAFVMRSESFDEVNFGTVLRPDSAIRSNISKSKKKPKITHRMAKKKDGGLRFLPLHLAMEGFLMNHFGGPEIAWSSLCKDFRLRGMSHRWESAMGGRAFDDLEEALRVFEIHTNQVGALLFIGDIFASTFIVPNPRDYRSLHASVIEDFFADSIYLAASNVHGVQEWKVDFSDEKVRSLDDIRSLLVREKKAWNEFHQGWTNGLTEADYDVSDVNRVGPYRLKRFLPQMIDGEENHIGDAIFGQDDRLLYLKTYRLSRAQARRGRYLRLFADLDWDPHAVAKSLGLSGISALRTRLKNVGLPNMVSEHG